MSSHFMRARWSDNDRYWGRFTYAKDGRGYRPFSFVFGSGKCEDDDYYERGGSTCFLRMSGFGHTLIIALPQLIRPERKWVDTSHYEWSKGPGSGYWDIRPREYGFSASEGFLQVFRGRRTMDSETDRTWGYHLPWTQWRHVRHSVYQLNHRLFWQQFDRDRPQPKAGVVGDWFQEYWKAKEECDKARFRFRDFDGEELIATTHIEEREWRFGTGWWKWLSLFRRAKVVRSLDISFSGETGRRKGSWKGGTVGHSIHMQRVGGGWEYAERAFRRYCAENNMTFLGGVREVPA